MAAFAGVRNATIKFSKRDNAKNALIELIRLKNKSMSFSVDLILEDIILAIQNKLNIQDTKIEVIFDDD
jgi:hypothetical protein